jgi:hypothetical protein
MASFQENLANLTLEEKRQIAINALKSIKKLGKEDDVNKLIIQKLENFLERNDDAFLLGKKRE